MPQNEVLTNRIREMLTDTPHFTEKKMFGGIAFMINDKMCICTVKTGLMCRIDPGRFDELIQKSGVRPMVMKGKEMNGYVLVNEDAVANNSDLMYWVNLCLAFNPTAKSSKKNKRTQTKKVASYHSQTHSFTVNVSFN